MAIERFDKIEMKNRTWVAATRIFIECLLHGDSLKVKRIALDEIMNMAAAFDKANETLRRIACDEKDDEK